MSKKSIMIDNLYSLNNMDNSYVQLLGEPVRSLTPYLT